MRVPWQSGGARMSKLFRKCIPAADHFDIGQDRCGRWITRGRQGVKGGTFFTCKEAVRLALSEPVEQAHVHVSTAGESNGRRGVPSPSGERGAP